MVALKKDICKKTKKAGYGYKGKWYIERKVFDYGKRKNGECCDAAEKRKAVKEAD